MEVQLWCKEWNPDNIAGIMLCGELTDVKIFRMCSISELFRNPRILYFQLYLAPLMNELCKTCILVEISEFLDFCNERTNDALTFDGQQVMQQQMPAARMAKKHSTSPHAISIAFKATPSTFCQRQKGKSLSCSVSS